MISTLFEKNWPVNKAEKSRKALSQKIAKEPERALRDSKEPIFKQIHYTVQIIIITDLLKFCKIAKISPGEIF